MKEVIQIPAEVAILFDQLILEAVNLLDPHLPFIHPAEDMAAA